MGRERARLGVMVVNEAGRWLAGGLMTTSSGEAAAGAGCLAPDWPLGSHDVPMPDADLTPAGIASLIGEFLERLDLREVTLVANDTGGAACGARLSGFGVDLRFWRPCSGLAGALVLAGEAAEYRSVADSVLGQVDLLGGTRLSLGRGELA